MRVRPLSFAIVAGASLLASACQVLVPFEDVPEGTGGSAGGATSSGGQGGGTTTTGTGPCTSPSDCPALSPCASATCVSGKCDYTLQPNGTVVADDSPLDCVQIVCDGEGHAVAVPDGDDQPDADPDDCITHVCSDGMEHIFPAEDGSLCGLQPDEPCKQTACLEGECLLQNKPDGTPFPDPYPEDCAAAVCMAGIQYFVGGLTDTCGADPTPTNCTAPFCQVESDMPATCVTAPVPIGARCKKAGGASGFCDGDGFCF